MLSQVSLYEKSFSTTRLLFRRGVAGRTSREAQDPDHQTLQQHGRLRNGDDDVGQRRGHLEVVRYPRDVVQERHIGNLHARGKQFSTTLKCVLTLRRHSIRDVHLK